MPPSSRGRAARLVVAQHQRAVLRAVDAVDLAADTQHAPVAEVDRERLLQVRLARARRDARTEADLEVDGRRAVRGAASRRSHARVSSRNAWRSRSHSAVKRGGLVATSSSSAWSAARRRRARVCASSLSGSRPASRSGAGTARRRGGTGRRAPAARAAGALRARALATASARTAAGTGSRSARTWRGGWPRSACRGRRVEAQRQVGGQRAHQAVVRREVASTSARSAARCDGGRTATPAAMARGAVLAAAHAGAVALGGVERLEDGERVEACPRHQRLEVGCRQDAAVEGRGRGDEEQRRQALAAGARVGARIGEEQAFGGLRERALEARGAPRAAGPGSSAADRCPRRAAQALPDPRRGPAACRLPQASREQRRQVPRRPALATRPRARRRAGTGRAAARRESRPRRGPEWRPRGRAGPRARRRRRRAPPALGAHQGHALPFEARFEHALHFLEARRGAANSSPPRSITTAHTVSRSCSGPIHWSIAARRRSDHSRHDAVPASRSSVAARRSTTAAGSRRSARAPRAAAAPPRRSGAAPRAAVPRRSAQARRASARGRTRSPRRG